MKTFTASFLLILSGILTTRLLAGEYCLQTDQGLDCSFKTADECRIQKENHQFCIPNPKVPKIKSKEIDNDILLLKEFRGSCYHPICLNYVQVVCSINEEQENDPGPIRCQED